mmetsp:Transcript_8497/g.13023  ORF Transcript_8497/g.13023 Transcript_8497/m.13023 type:complete len:959 (+) Transcript_8497:404-3280(+)
MERSEDGGLSVSHGGVDQLELLLASGNFAEEMSLLLRLFGTQLLVVRVHFVDLLVESDLDALVLGHLIELGSGREPVLHVVGHVLHAALHVVEATLHLGDVGDQAVELLSLEEDALQLLLELGEVVLVLEVLEVGQLASILVVNQVHEVGHQGRGGVLELVLDLGENLVDGDIVGLDKSELLLQLDPGESLFVSIESEPAGVDGIFRVNNVRRHAGVRQIDSLFLEEFDGVLLVSIAVVNLLVFFITGVFKHSIEFIFLLDVVEVNLVRHLVIHLQAELVVEVVGAFLLLDFVEQLDRVGHSVGRSPLDRVDQLVIVQVNGLVHHLESLELRIILGQIAHVFALDPLSVLGHGLLLLGSKVGHADLLGLVEQVFDLFVELLVKVISEVLVVLHINAELTVVIDVLLVFELLHASDAVLDLVVEDLHQVLGLLSHIDAAAHVLADELEHFLVLLAVLHVGLGGFEFFAGGSDQSKSLVERLHAVQELDLSLVGCQLVHIIHPVPGFVGHHIFKLGFPDEAGLQVAKSGQILGVGVQLSLALVQREIVTEMHEEVLDVRLVLALGVHLLNDLELMRVMLGNLFQQRSLFLENHLQEEHTVDLVGVAMVEDAIVLLEDSHLLVELLLHKHQAVVLGLELLGREIAVTEDLLVGLEEEVAVAGLCSLSLLDTIVEELKSIVNAAILEVSLSHGGQVGEALVVLGREHGLLKHGVVVRSGVQLHIHKALAHVVVADFALLAVLRAGEATHHRVEVGAQIDYLGSELVLLHEVQHHFGSVLTDLDSALGGGLYLNVLLRDGVGAVALGQGLVQGFMGLEVGKQMLVEGALVAQVQVLHDLHHAVEGQRVVGVVLEVVGHLFVADERSTLFRQVLDLLDIGGREQLDQLIQRVDLHLGVDEGPAAGLLHEVGEHGVEVDDSFQVLESNVELRGFLASAVTGDGAVHVAVVESHEGEQLVQVEGVV